jgi:hypothetical protein
VLSTGLVMSGAAMGPAYADTNTTPLTTEGFAHPTTADGDWFLPAAGTCLTAGSSTAQRPIPACSSTPIDADGSGALRLTSNLNAQVGNVFNSISLPTSQGLDISFNTFQYNRNLATSTGYTAGADGISFILAATDPENPAPPTNPGATGGSLGYSSSGGTRGVPFGYLGFGIDVYGNFTNGDFGGTNCTDPHVWGEVQDVGVRGPGNNTRGYCMIDSVDLADGDLDKPTETARPTAVPVEIAINPSASTVTTSGGIVVPARSFAMRVTPYSSAPQTLISALPTIDPTLAFPAGWVDPDTGLPYQLSFGWGASTGGSNEIHEIGQLQTQTLSGKLPVFALDVANGSYRAGEQGTVQVTPRLDASAGAESRQATVTTTFPAGLTPQSGSFTTANGYSCATTSQVSTCRYAPSTPVAAGSSLPVLDIPVAVPSSTAPGSYTVTAKVSSTDAKPTTASRALSVTLPRPGAPTSLTAVPDESAVLVSWQPPTTGQPAARYRVSAAPGSATCVTTGLSCLLGGVAGESYTITVVAITADGLEGAAATTTTVGTVAAPAVPASPPADAPLTLTTTDGAITTAEPGQEITVIGTGFLPYSTVMIVIYSTPTTLGTVTTDGSGSFSKPVTIPTTLEAGAHSLVAYGVDPSGNVHSLRLNITVAAGAATTSRALTGSPLAYTGSTFNPMPVVVGGAGLLLVGIALLIVVRSRRPEEAVADSDGAESPLEDAVPAVG